MPQDRSKVVVIGAGIVGVSTAIWALREGFLVTLIDRAAPGQATSSGNAGLLASAAIVPVPVPGLLSKAPRMALDPRQPLFVRWSHLIRSAPWLWRYLRQANVDAATKRALSILPLTGDSLADHLALAEGTGAERWILPCDYLAGYPSRATYHADRFAWQLRREAGFEVESLDGEALRIYDPAIGTTIGCAALVPGHGRITDPGRYVQTLAQHAQKQGVQILRAEIEAVLREKGHVTGIRAGGEVIECDKVVVTAGIWSGPLAKDLGLKAHLAPESGFHLELWEPSVMPRSPMMISEGKFVMTPMDGRLRLAGMVGHLGLDAVAPEAPYRLFEHHIKRVLPSLTWGEATRWMGHRPAMSDSCPMIGEVPNIAGAYVGFGHDHVGLTAGPRTGQILAHLLAGKRPNIDLSPYSPDRFA
ncbi:MAG: FAD-binding oxidoreductase [Pseudomonadota bacterium]